MYKFLILCFLILINGFSSGLCQDVQNKINPEAEFMKIRKKALEGNISEAEIQISELLDSFPDYGDAWIFLARIYGWQKKYDQATEILDSIILRESDNIDALQARLDLAIWKGEHEIGVKIVEQIISVHPNVDEIFLISSGEISRSDAEEIYKNHIAHLMDTEFQETESDSIVTTTETDSLDYKLSDTYNDQNSKTDLRAGYYFDTFSEPYSRFWQVFQLGTCHYLPFGKVLPGINIGNLYADLNPAVHATELQFEIEAYPILSSMNYAWIDYAFSPGRYFPSHRLFLEIWQKLTQGWVASVGLNYYYFYRHLYIPNVSIEKYYRTYWFSSKVYFYMKDKGTTTSLYLNARKYFTDTDYLQLTLGTGTAPDEPFEIEISLMRLNAHVIRLTYFKSLNDIFSFRCGAGYSLEKYAASQYRNRFDGNISLIYSLKKRQ